MDLAQCFSVNTVCKVNWYRGFDPSLNMNKVHLSVSLLWLLYLIDSDINRPLVSLSSVWAMHIIWLVSTYSLCLFVLHTCMHSFSISTSMTFCALMLVDRNLGLYRISGLFYIRYPARYPVSFARYPVSFARYPAG